MLDQFSPPRVPGPGFAALATSWSGLQPLPTFLRASEEIGQSWFRFLQMRVDKDAELFQRLVRTSSPVGAATVYAQFSQDAATDYSAELTELNSIVWSMVTRSGETPR